MDVKNLVFKRVFVEKKAGFDVEAKGLLNDLQVNLGISSLKGLRLFVRYDCTDLEPQEYQAAKNIVFFEPPIDNLYEDNLPKISNNTNTNTNTNTNNDDEEAGEGGVVVNLFAVEYLLGQYDQRADFAEQALKLINHSSATKIRTGKVIALIGNLSSLEVDRVKSYYINPVESHEASIDKPTLEISPLVPKDVSVVENFGVASINELNLAMSLEDVEFCVKYFRGEGRAPTLTEIRVLDTYWSDHCRHTTFLTELENVDIEPDYIREIYDVLKPKSLMDAATRAAKVFLKAGKLPELDVSDEVNACSIEVTLEVDGKPQQWFIMFKNETHNHPTEIEPFGGAATCLGGAIRDPLSGRAYVYQAMRVSGSGDPRTKIADTLPGKLSQRKITTTAAAGYSSYGNQIGLATGQVAEIYNEGYIAKRMELGAVIAAVPKDNVVREKPSPSDVVILLGGRTGRDGCGGATGSSKSHNFSTTSMSSVEVQKGNPPQERAIVRLFRNSDATRLIKRCNDFGAGGVCVAIGELADGLRIDLDKVPKKYEGLNGTELAISESQERMAVVVSAENAKKFIELADSENLEATTVAEVVSEPRLIMYWRGKKIVDMSREFLNSNGAPRKSSAKINTPDVSGFFSSANKNVTVKDALSSLSLCSRQGLVERFDSTIGAGTVLLPFGGKSQLTPVDCMVSKIPILRGETDACTFMSYAYNSELAKLSPFHSACYAVLESVAKIVASGGDWRRIYFTFQEVFEKLGNDPLRWGKPLAALLGAYFAQIQLERAAIGGKDSMSGSYITENFRIDVPPTLVSFAVAVGKADNVISPEFKQPGNNLVLVEIPRDENNLPDFNTAKTSFDNIHKAILEGQVLSAHSLGANGLVSSIIQCFGNDIGIQINKNEDLFTPCIGSILLEVPFGKSLGFGRVIGQTTSEKVFTHKDYSITLKDAIKTWNTPLLEVFPLEKPVKSEPLTCHTPNIVKYSGIKCARPNVFVPVFPGTNCEYDSVRAFERAGATTEIVVMRNLSKLHIEQSIEKMAKAIDNSQIIMLSGGFSASDEPDGSAKYIAAVLRTPRLSEAIHRLLNERNGLILGICNGFQALIKLGLVPYGEIRPITEEYPTLTYNSIGRHISKMVNTRITSNLSPWLTNMKIGEEYIIPISHGEGRFVAPQKVLDELLKNGQIATQYIDNPNGSYWAIEGITSPDGRIFGKMGHNERVGVNIAKNITGNKEQNIFKNGVKYFQ